MKEKRRRNWHAAAAAAAAEEWKGSIALDRSGLDNITLGQIIGHFLRYSINEGWTKNRDCCVLPAAVAGQPSRGHYQTR